MTIREISIALVLAACACVGCFLFWRARSTSGWPRKSLLVAGTLVILFAASESLDWRAKRGGRMPPPVYTEQSPDGQFVAEIVEPDGDLIPTDQVRISVRRSGHVLAEEVSKGTFEPNVDWLDDRTLQLTFPADWRPALCGGSWSGATIICKQVPRSEFKPRLRV
jgi:hypothetical protein